MVGDLQSFQIGPAVFDQAEPELTAVILGALGIGKGLRDPTKDHRVLGQDALVGAGQARALRIDLEAPDCEGARPERLQPTVGKQSCDLGGQLGLRVGLREPWQIALISLIQFGKPGRK